jgi:hypothetical protein
MTQQLHAYVVSLSWSSGMMSLIPVMSGGGPEQASAVAVVEAMRQEPFPVGHLGGVIVREIPIEFLRTAVRMIETGSVEPAPVVRLVENHGSEAASGLDPATPAA